MYTELKKIQKNKTPVWIRMVNGENLYGFILSCSESQNFVKIRHLAEIKIGEQEEEITIEDLASIIESGEAAITTKQSEAVEDFKAITSLIREENIEECHLKPYEFMSGDMYEALCTLSVELYGESLEPNLDDILTEERNLD